MLKNYLKTSVRNLIKNKGSTAINIFGLATGIACCVLLLLYIQEELSYDRFYENNSQIFRVVSSRSFPTHDRHFALTPKSLADALLQDFPEIAAATRFRYVGDPLVRFEDKSFVEKGFLFADSNFFNVFATPLIRGDPKTVLQEPNTIVITEETAQKYFGENEPVGKILTTDFGEHTVTGITKNTPHNSHLHFNLIASLERGRYLKSQSWSALTAYTYIVLKTGYRHQSLEAKFPEMVKRYVQTPGHSYSLQPLSKIHLHSHLEFELEPNGDIFYVYLFSVLSLFLLIIACINFMNLATARSMNRAREVGMRKVLGSLRRQLIGQFLAESIVLSLLALGFAIVLIELSLPYFNNITRMTLDLHYFKGMALPGLIVLASLVGILAGCYPAFFLSSFQPASVLKDQSSSGTRGVGFRNGLVTFQILISIALLFSAAVIEKQMEYIQNKPLGFEKEYMMIIQRASSLGLQRQAFKQTLLNHTGVVEITGSNSMPGGAFNEAPFHPEGLPGTLTLYDFIVDSGFLETMGLELVEGRSFSENLKTDLESSVIINETAVKQFSLRNPLGKRLIMSTSNPEDSPTFTIIGIVHDFNFLSLHEEIGPLMIRGMDAKSANLRYLIIKIRPENIQKTLEFLEQTWKTFVPGSPFLYSFLDDRLDNLYRSEQTTRNIVEVFTGLAVLIACLGLFGLVAFISEQRTKEIGIRKVLGASVEGIILLLLQSYLKLFLIAFVIAAPLAYSIMNRWLQNFVYRTNISLGVFFIAASASVLIILLAVGSQTIRAARANPMDALRYE